MAVNYKKEYFKAVKDRADRMTCFSIAFSKIIDEFGLPKHAINKFTYYYHEARNK